MKLNKPYKSGQVTIFIIVAILIVASIIIILVFYGDVGFLKTEKLNPQQYIEKCGGDVVLEAIDIMLPQGGYLEPRFYKLYDDKKIAYLCYNKNYYASCINQEPMYMKHLEDEIKIYIEPKIADCFDKLKTEQEKQGKNFEMGDMDLNVELKPKQVEVVINRDVDISGKGGSESHEVFKESVLSPIFELGEVAVEIVNQEAKFCNFEYVGYMMLYPKFDIDKKAVGGAETSAKIYIIGDRRTGKKLNIAIRGCAFPAGM